MHYYNLLLRFTAAAAIDMPCKAPTAQHRAALCTRGLKQEMRLGTDTPLLLDLGSVACQLQHAAAVSM
jgi:hypothetical protein